MSVSSQHNTTEGTGARVRQFIRVVNWSKYQHYRDRNPPWVKLYRETLTSRFWVTASDASRVLAIAPILLAAQNENLIPLDPEYIRRVAYLNQEPDFSPLITSDFIEIVDLPSAGIAACEHDASG